MFPYHKATPWFLAVSGFPLTTSLFACQSPEASAPSTSPVAVAEGEDINLNGAGASFPAPLYQRYFVNWALTEGDEYAKELGYVPLTREVAQKVRFTVHQELATR